MLRIVVPPVPASAAARYVSPDGRGVCGVIGAYGFVEGFESNLAIRGGAAAGAAAGAPAGAPGGAPADAWTYDLLINVRRAERAHLLAKEPAISDRKGDRKVKATINALLKKLKKDPRCTYFQKPFEWNDARHAGRYDDYPEKVRNPMDLEVSVRLCTVTYYANRDHNLTRSP